MEMLVNWLWSVIMMWINESEGVYLFGYEKKNIYVFEFLIFVWMKWYLFVNNCCLFFFFWIVEINWRF